MKNYTASEMSTLISNRLERLDQLYYNWAEKWTDRRQETLDREKFHAYVEEMEEILEIISSTYLNSALLPREEWFTKAYNSADKAEMYYEGNFHKIGLVYNYPYEKPLLIIRFSPQKVFRSV